MGHFVRGSVPQPGAGKDFTLTISTNEPVRLLAITFKLVTSATVANRRPSIQLQTQETDLFYAADFGQPQAASLTITYSLARGAMNNTPNALVTGEFVSANLPDFPLEPGDIVASKTTAIDTGDQISAIFYHCRILSRTEYIAAMESYAAQVS